jgi:dynein intermediate chain
MSTDGVCSNQGVTDRFQGHKAPVTGLSLHPSGGQADFSDLILTSSLDWTCKLWSRKNPSKFLCSFQDGSDAVYDCQWSPAHPGVFGTVDGTGGLSVWNVGADTEVPVVREQVGNRALNKLSFSNDGKRIACGDSSGSIYIYDSSEVRRRRRCSRVAEWQRLTLASVCRPHSR